MNYFDTHINETVLAFFQENSNVLSDYNQINELLKASCGVYPFFNEEDEILLLQSIINNPISVLEEPNRRAYGDFQTNKTLAKQVSAYSFSKDDSVEFILEPTCGKGIFIVAALEQFTQLKRVVGVEIYQPYVWETKFNVLTHFLHHPTNNKPDITIYHADAFDFPYDELAKETAHLKTLIIGNPPWVTNSELSSINSTNLPKKSNFKKHRGLDAMTGKGNFDIGEHIALLMLQCFQYHDGLFAFLVKNAVIKNIIHDQKRNNYNIATIEKLTIDAMKEFNVSVNAALFFAQLKQSPTGICKEFDFYTHQEITTFGWYKDKYVYSIKDYDLSSSIDGKSVFTWRSGIKHDCSKVMEFERKNGHYLNGFKVDLDIEKDLVYGLLKSSDLKHKQTNTYRKSTIITQQKIGQATNYIEQKYPLTYDYLDKNREYFDRRKSSIYKGKPSFSIFGVGDYSFAPYKVAISGMYKSTHFTLVTTDDGKPIMLDDTCYFIGFNELKQAQIAHYLVNSSLVQQFLKSIIFSDAKRSINKDILMRIDFKSIYTQTNFNDMKKEIEHLTREDWKQFGDFFTKDTIPNQIALF